MTWRESINNKRDAARKVTGYSASRSRFFSMKYIMVFVYFILLMIASFMYISAGPIRYGAIGAGVLLGIYVLYKF